MDKLTLGQKLKTLRKSKKITMEKLAEIFGKKYGTGTDKGIISIWENDKRIPTNKSLQMYCDYFNVSMDYLIGNTDIPQIVKNINKETTEDIIATLTPEQQSELNMLLKQHNGLLMMSGIEPTENDKRELSRLITLSYLKSLGKIIK